MQRWQCMCFIIKLSLDLHQFVLFYLFCYIDFYRILCAVFGGLLLLNVLVSVKIFFFWIMALKSAQYWCPNDFDGGIEIISECICSCNKELSISEDVCSLIATFVIGEKWPIELLIKKMDFGYDIICVNPNEMGQVVYRKCLERAMNQFGSKGMVLLNRDTARKLIRYKSLLEQNVVNGAKFECTASFKGKGRIYAMW